MIKLSTDGLLQYRIKRRGDHYYIEVLTEEKVWTWPWNASKYELVWRPVGKSGFPVKMKERIFADVNPPLEPCETAAAAFQIIQGFWQSQVTDIIQVQQEVISSTKNGNYDPRPVNTVLNSVD